MSKSRFLPALLAALLFFGPPAHAGSSALSAGPVSSVQALPTGSAPVSQPMDAQRVWIDNVEGSVLLKKAGASDFSLAAKGASLSNGDILKTGSGSCEVVFDDQTRLSIAPDTEIVITEALKNIAANTRTTLLKMHLGKIKAKVTKVTPGSRFEITTPSAVAAVRGTTLILQSFFVNNQYISKLYVDESKSGVDFTNTKSGESKFVPPYSDSSSSSDGTLQDPEGTSEDEKNEFNEGFEGGGSDDTGDLADDPNDPGSSDDGTSGQTDDAQIDKTSEQNASGGAAQDATEDAAQEAGAGASAQDEAERLLISQEIARLRGDLDFSHADANLAQISDAQTGKVMTDVHGNRVRVDQYIFKQTADSKTTDGPSGDMVQFLSLTLRTGEYQNGVTSVLFGVNFNAPITVPLRQLPWDEYLNVVEDGDLNPNYGSGYEGPYYDQFIVHEGADASAASEGPGLFPHSFFVAFLNPVRGDGGRDLIEFGEEFSDPLKIFSDSKSEYFWVQGRAAEITIVQPFDGDQIIAGRDVFGGDFLRINGEYIDIFYENYGGGDGPQSASFADNFTPDRLQGTGAINYYRKLLV
ncbi:MAG TPA: FecR domain-containing protein, partial [Candidatus Omnitrophota bacterium]|nr:FecR domain-containing protein [Candidatus Omnitrophota bacterium]